MDNLIYAVRLELQSPLPDSATDQFDKLIKRKYKMHPKDSKFEVITFSPNRWYTSKELLNLFKLVRGQIENKWEQDIKMIKKKKEEPEEKESDIKTLKNDLIEDLRVFKNLFPKMVIEYKNRFNTAISGKSQEEQDRLKKENDFEWIEHPKDFVKKIQDTVLLDKEIKEIQDASDLGYSYDIERRENQKTEPKQTGWHAELWTKFKDIENELDLYAEDIGKLSDKFKTMPIPEPSVETKTAASEGEKSVHQVKPEHKFRKVYKYISEDKKKSIIDRLLDSKGGDTATYGEPTDVEWVVSTHDLNKEIEKIKEEKEDLDHKRSLVKDNEKEFEAATKIFGEKKEELDLLKDIASRRESRENHIKESKKDWTSDESASIKKYSEQLAGGFEKRVNKLVTDFDEFVKETVLDVKINAEEKQELEDKKNQVHKELDKKEEYKGEKYLQVQFVTSILKNIHWYKKLYSLYHACYWSHAKPAEIALEERNQDKFNRIRSKEADIFSLRDDFEHVEELRTEAYKAMEHFVGIDIHSKNAPYAAATIAEKDLKEFAEVCSAYLKKLEGHGQSVELFRTSPGKSMKTFAHYIKKISEEIGEDVKLSDFDKIFPEAETLAKIKDIEHYDLAEKELGEIYKFFRKEYITPSAGFKRNMERAEKDPKDILKKYIKATLDVFIEMWQKREKSPQKKPSSNRIEKRYPELYKMIKSLEGKVFPELAEPSGRPESGPGRPSTQSIIDYIDKTWLNAKPELFKKGLYEHFNPKGEIYTLKQKDPENPDDSGGGGGAGKPARKKEPKNIVNLTDQKLLELVENFLKDHLKSDEGKEFTPEMEADKFINSLLVKMGINLKREFHSTGEPIDISTVITGIDKVLSNIGFTLRRVKIYAPGTTRRAPPPGMTFSSDKEAEQSTSWYQKHPEVKKRVPGIAPGTKYHEEGKPVSPTYRGLIEPGTYEDRRDVTRISLMGSPEEQLKEAIRIHDKVVRLYKNISYLLNREIKKTEFPAGLMESISDLKHELGKEPPSKEQVEKEEKEKKEKEKNKKEALLLPLSYKLAQKFIGKDFNTIEEKDMGFAVVI